jgi:hypothetical protein
MVALVLSPYLLVGCRDVSVCNRSHSGPNSDLNSKGAGHNAAYVTTGVFVAVALVSFLPKRVSLERTSL